MTQQFEPLDQLVWAESLNYHISSAFGKQTGPHMMIVWNEKAHEPVLKCDLQIKQPVRGNTSYSSPGIKKN